MKYPFLLIPMMILPLLANSSCDQDSANAKQKRLQQESSSMALKVVGMPNIVNFTELRDMKMVYELKDQAELSTYTYVRDMVGNLHHVCDSVGMAINASIQMSNPLRTVNGSRSSVVGQPEPNGAYMPDGLSASYVKCIGVAGLQIFYEEDKVMVAPQKMLAVNSYQAGYDVRVKGPNGRFYRMNTDGSVTITDK